MPKKILTGTVVSNKMDKTIVVNVKELRQHAIYEKRYVRSKKYYAHDEKNEAQVGDTVEIVEARPISKTKTWILKEITEKSKL